MGETELMPLLLEAGFLAGPAAQSYGPQSVQVLNHCEPGAVPSRIPGYARRGWRVDRLPTRVGGFGRRSTGHGR